MTLRHSPKHIRVLRSGQWTKNSTETTHHYSLTRLKIVSHGDEHTNICWRGYVATTCVYWQQALLTPNPGHLLSIDKHTHAHARTHASTHTHTYTHTHIHTYTHTHIHTYTHAHAREHRLAHRHEQSHLDMHARAHSYIIDFMCVLVQCSSKSQHPTLRYVS